MQLQYKAHKDATKGTDSGQPCIWELKQNVKINIKQKGGL